jgi:hypothetical protein
MKFFLKRNYCEFCEYETLVYPPDNSRCSGCYKHYTKIKIKTGFNKTDKLDYYFENDKFQRSDKNFTDQ